MGGRSRHQDGGGKQRGRQGKRALSVDSGSEDSDDEDVDDGEVMECSECPHPLLASDKRYKKMRCHEKCGKARRASLGMIKNFPPEKAYFDRLRTSNKSGYAAIMKPIVMAQGTTGKSIAKIKSEFMINISSSMVRSTTLKREEAQDLMNEGEYKAHWRAKGHSKAVVKKWWKNAIGGKTQEHVEEENSEVVVGVRVPTRLSKSDILERRKEVDTDKIGKAGMQGALNGLKKEMGMPVKMVSELLSGIKDICVRSY